MSVPPLHHTVLSHIAADWPEFHDLRAAASAFSAKSRLTNSISILVNELKVAFGAALLSTGQRTTAASDADAAALDATVQHAHRLHSHARALCTDGRRALAEAWHWRPSQIDLLLSQLAGAVGAPMADSPPPPALPAPISGPRPVNQPLEQCVPLFLAAVAQGMSLNSALPLFGALSDGAYSHDDRCFYPAAPTLGPVSDRASLLHDAARIVVRGGPGEQDITIFLSGGRIAAIAAPKRLRIRWLEDARRDAGGLESLPDFIALPRDEAGRPILPK